MKEQRSAPPNGSASHLEEVGAGSRTLNCRPTPSSTDAPVQGRLVDLPFRTDAQVATQTLLEIRRLLETCYPLTMSEGCRRLLLRAELRVCFLLLHFGSPLIQSREWVSIHSRSRILEESLRRSPRFQGDPIP